MKARPWRTVAVIAGFLLAVVASGAWLTRTALALEEAEREASRKARLEESVRLALWRMESAITPILGVESARPASDYQVLFRPEGDGAPLFIASPLLGDTPPYVHLHFEMDTEGRLASPQVPRGEDRALVAGRFATQPTIDRAAALLERLGRFVSRDALEAALPADTRPAPAAARRFSATTKGPDRTEYVWRERAVGSTYSYGSMPERVQVAVKRPGEERTIELTEATRATTAIAPLWMEGELLLVRRARAGNRELLQGVWLDWQALSRALLEGIVDRLPGAALVPLSESDDQSRRLASLPVALLPGTVTADPETSGSTLRLPLVLAGVGLTVGALAMLALALGAIRLGERRAAFVSAVTHELRTPLTSLQAYAEMLRDRRITDQEKTQRYLDTMHREARRLAHLVDNVLAYSRIDKSGKARRDRVPLDELVDRMREGLADRAASVGLELAIEAIPVAAVADPIAVERIVDNLVDNACKYAADGERIVVALRAEARRAILSVADDGPGVSRDAEATLFVPFTRSAEQAAGSAPGVGLGLALCRRLARAMGGEVVHAASSKGAVFELRLPRAE